MTPHSQPPHCCCPSIECDCASQRRRSCERFGRILDPWPLGHACAHGAPGHFSSLYIANGVTGVRDMGGDLEEPTGDLSARYIRLRLWREAIERGSLVG